MYVLMGSVAFFAAEYAFSYLVLFRKYKHPQRSEASSCTMSMAHGPLVSLLAAYDVAVSIWRLDAPNTRFENALMDYSIAYFAVDLLHYLLFARGKVLFIAHHVATAFVMVSCRYYAGHGAVALMALLVVAESTSACQNVWSLSAFAVQMDLSERAVRIHEGICLPFYCFYTLARGVVAPVLACRLSHFYHAGNADHVIPRWLVQSWMCIVILAIFASVLWVLDLWVELVRRYRTQCKKTPSKIY